MVTHKAAALAFKNNLRTCLNQYFSLSDLEDMCFQLDIEWDNIKGDTRQIKVNSLIEFVQDRGSGDVQGLIKLMMEARPRIAEIHALLGQLQAMLAAAVTDAEQESPMDKTPTDKKRGGTPDDDGSPKSKPLPTEIANRWALLIGINNYTNPAYYPTLSYCVADVLAMQAQLESLGYAVTTLHDGPDSTRLPNRGNILNEIYKLVGTPSTKGIAGKNDLVLIQFSCHGMLVGGKPFLVCKDTQPQSILGNPPHDMTGAGLSVDYLKELLQKSETQCQVVFMDACHMGLDLGGKRSVTDPEFIQNVIETARGFAMLAGSTSEQVAQEWSGAQHGVFTAYLLKGLAGEAKDGSGFVTVSSLRNFVVNGVKKWSFSRPQAQIQEPTGEVQTLGEIPLADLRNTSTNAPAVVATPPPDQAKAGVGAGASRGTGPVAPIVTIDASKWPPEKLSKFMFNYFTELDTDSIITNSFPDVWFQTSKTAPWGAKINELISFCNKQDRVPELLALLRAKNQTMFDKNV